MTDTQDPSGGLGTHRGDGDGAGPARAAVPGDVGSAGGAPPPAGLLADANHLAANLALRLLLVDAEAKNAELRELVERVMATCTAQAEVLRLHGLVPVEPVEPERALQ